MKGCVAYGYEVFESFNCIYNSLIVCGLHFIIFCFFINMFLMESMTIHARY